MRTLQEEINQPTPFASPTQEAVMGLLRTASLIRHRFSTLMEAHALTFSQYNVLRILRGAGEPLPTMEISERMIETTPGITRLVNGLEAQGLLSRDRSTADQRQVLCSITPAGLERLRALDEPVNALDERCLAMLSRAEQNQLTALLATVRSELT